MSVKLLIKHHFEFLSFIGGCAGSSESTLVKMSHSWKSNAVAQIVSHLSYHDATDFHANNSLIFCIKFQIDLTGYLWNKRDSFQDDHHGSQTGCLLGVSIACLYPTKRCYAYMGSDGCSIHTKLHSIPPILP